MTSLHENCHSGTLFRVDDPKQGRPTLARLDGDNIVAIPGDIPKLHDRHRTGAALPTGRVLDDPDLALLPPVSPSKIVCVGLNYRQHAREMDKDIPDEPLMFMKPPTALIGPATPIELPQSSNEVHHEGELAIVIGQRLKDADRDEAAAAIFGYTCACDVSARDIQRREGRYTRGKGFDTFAPVGPSIALAPQFDPAEHELTCHVDGELRQQSTLDDFIFPVDRVVSFISGVMTLLPGDVVFTGTPHGVGPIEAGQSVEVAIDGIGTLKNPVTDR